MLHETRMAGRRFSALLYAGLVAGAQAWPGHAQAEERIFIYPAAGQSDSQLADDRYACHLRAVGESGFDPTRVAMTSRPTETQVVQAIPPNESKGATGKGMVTGAVAGAVIGAATNNDAGQAAVAGAALGTLIGNSIEKKGAEAAEWQARAEGEKKLEESEARAAKTAERRANYRSALSQCLVLRGYSVR